MMTSRATIGEAVINTVPMATNQGFINILCNENLLDNVFLVYWIKHHKQALEARGYGATFKELSKSNFKSMPIFLPPLPEQRAIAHILQTVQNAIQARRNELDMERERKAALMQHLFTHGTRGEATKQTEIGEMPESWEICSLHNIAQVAYGLTVNETRRKTAHHVPYLAVANVTRGALRLDEVKRIGTLPGDNERYRLLRGDVLLVEGNGNPALLGSAAVWNDELPFALHQNHLIRARPNQDRVVPAWLMGYINSDDGRAQLFGKAKTSSGLRSINSNLVAHLLIPLPSISEQRMITETMDTCDSKITALEKELALQEELFRALLEELMSGRLSALPLVEAEGGAREALS